MIAIPVKVSEYWMKLEALKYCH